MQGTLSTDLLVRLSRATPEQLVAVERVLAMSAGENGVLAGEMSPEGEVDQGEYGGGGRQRFVFRRAGRFWLVKFDGGEEFVIEDTLGARYVDYLLHHPSKPISAYDLEIAIQPEKANAPRKNSVQTRLDPHAARQYVRELGRLRSERDVAEEAGRLGEVDRLDRDIEALEDALKGGASSGDAGERARGNVTKAIGAVRRNLRKGGKAEQAFGEHIERSVNTGYECMYVQALGRIWGKWVK